MQPAAVGISDHSGWAIFVTIGVRNRQPIVIDRRRIEIIEPGLPRQPYEHDTHGLAAEQAEAMVKEVRESAMHCAERALSKLCSSVGPAKSIVAAVLREPPLVHLPKSVAEAHASYHVTNRADSMLYHDALTKAASTLKIGVELISRGDEHQRAATALGIEPTRMEKWLAELRLSLGPPWQKDHRDAAARAIAALSRHTALSLP